MQGLIEQYGLALVFANVLALSLGLPVPALPTLVLVGAGYALRGGSDAWLAGVAALGVSVLASLLGDLAGIWPAGVSVIAPCSRCAGCRYRAIPA